MLLTERKSLEIGKPLDSSILIKEKGFTVRNLIYLEEKIQAYHLRHRIFCEELGWVPESGNALEMDEYDDNAVFLGVFNLQDKLLAFLRILLPGGPFMLEKVFSSLIGGHKIRKESDTAEVSRLCTLPEARNDMISGNFGAHNITMLLYKGVYHWCNKNGIRYLYLVVEHKVYRLLHAKGFPCKLAGELKTMPDGIVAAAAIMDWREFEVLNAVKRSEMLKWFTQYQSTPA